MVAIGDKFGKASKDSTYAIATTVKTTRTAGVSVLEAYDLSKFAEDTPVFVLTYKKTIDPLTNVASVTNVASYKAIVNAGANTLTNLTLAPGYTDLGNAEGDFIECVATSFWNTELINGILQEHKPSGAHKAITADSVTSTGNVSGADGNFSGDLKIRSTSVETVIDEVGAEKDYVVKGLVWSGDAYNSTRAASMTAGVVYINGKRVSVAAISNRLFTASKDTYIDVGDDGVVDYAEVSVDNTTIPALAANHIRIAIVQTGASSIVNQFSINQGQIPDRADKVRAPGYGLGVNRLYGIDFNGNVLYPTFKKRFVGGSARQSGSTSGAPGGSEVSYSGCNQIRFMCKPNTNYRVHFFEPAVSGASGSGLFGITPYLSTTIGANTRALVEMGMAYMGFAHGLEKTIDFNSENVSGLAYIEFRLRSSGWSGTMTMNSDTSRTNNMWIEEIQ